MLKVAVLSSHRAPGLESLLRHPERGRSFEIVCVVSTHADFPQSAFVKGHGVPMLSHPIRGVTGRAEYDRMTARMLRYLQADAVVLLSYLYVLTEPMLSAFPDRIINIHDSDLTVEGSDGERRFVGLHSTLDALISGETSTRSTVHLVTEKVNAGPVLLVSDPYEVPAAAAEAVKRGDFQSVKRFAWIQRDRMMRSWGESAVRALQLLADVSRPEIEEVAV